MLEGNTTEEERHNARHGEAIGEEVTRVRAECDETRFNGRVVVEIRVFEEK